MAMELATSLVGCAREVLTDMKDEEILDFKALESKLTLRLEPKDLTGVYQAQLQSRKRHRTESIPELLQDVKRLTRKAFPTADDGTRNFMIVHSFISALDNEQLELFVHMKDAATGEEAAKAAMSYETFQVSRTPKCQCMCGNNKKNAKTSTRGQTDQQDAMTELVGRVAKLESGEQKSEVSTPRQSSDVCWYCDRKGHYRRECFRMKADHEKGIHKPLRPSRSNTRSLKKNTEKTRDDN